MSASLVGSEMCIRDSLAISRKTGWQAGGTLRVGEEGRSNRSARSHSKAVSYTHLTLPTICSV
eukprot:13342481-Alexandrium_andersonii.AAC.1